MSNHPLTFQGRQGLERVFELLGVNVSQLDTIIVGKENGADYIRAASVMWAFRNCSSLRLPGVANYTMWITDDFANFLQDMGFSGELALGGMFDGELVNLTSTHRRPGYSFTVRSIPFPSDGSFAVGKHGCLPGPPDFVAADLEASHPELKGQASGVHADLGLACLLAGLSCLLAVLA